jgi:hypothetical protein
LNGKAQLDANFIASKMIIWQNILPKIPSKEYREMMDSMTQNAKTQDLTYFEKDYGHFSTTPPLHLAKKHNKSNELENCCSKPI